MCGDKPARRSSAPLPIKLVQLLGNSVHRVWDVGTRTLVAPLRVSIGQQIPFTNRRHLMFVPERLENLLGQISFAKVIASEQQKVLPPEHPDARLVQEVGGRIVRAMQDSVDTMDGYSGHLKNYKWTFTVIQSKEVNAFVVPGGKVVVYTGLLDLVNRDKDKLAVVLGHEASHVLARHSSEGVGFKLIVGALATAAVAALRVVWRNGRRRQRQLEAQQQLQQRQRVHPLAAGFAARSAVEQELAESTVQQDRLDEQQLAQHLDHAASALSHFLMELPNSRRHEVEADLVGLKLAGLAGFNGLKAPEVWRDMAGRNNSNPLDKVTFMSTHPASGNREQILSRELAAMQERGWGNKALRTVFTQTSYFSL